MKTDEESTAILIPAYKPDLKLSILVSDLSARGYRIVVVNDGSGKEFDGIFASLANGRLPTGKALADVVSKREFRGKICRFSSFGCIDIVEYEQNAGKGEALKTGYEHIKNALPDIKYIVTADADGQHTPDDIGKTLRRLISEHKKIVLGSREFKGKVPAKSLLGNKITVFAFSLASGVKISDTQTGLRAFDASLLSDMIEISGLRYEYEINVLLWAAKQKIELCEEPIETVYIDGNASSHFNPFKDSYKIYSCIFGSMKNQKMLKYIVSSLFSAIVDYTLFFLFSFLIFDAVFNGMSLSVAGFNLNAEELSNFVSTWSARLFSSIINYRMNKRWVFKSNAAKSASIPEYFGLVLIMAAINPIILNFLTSGLNISRWLAKPIVETVLFICNYFIQKNLIFTRKCKQIDK